jgi:hypothetical protein
MTLLSTPSQSSDQMLIDLIVEAFENDYKQYLPPPTQLAVTNV